MAGEVAEKLGISTKQVGEAAVGEEGAGWGVSD